MPPHCTLSLVFLVGARTGAHSLGTQIPLLAINAELGETLYNGAQFSTGLPFVRYLISQGKDPLAVQLVKLDLFVPENRQAVAQVLEQPISVSALAGPLQREIWRATS